MKCLLGGGEEDACFAMPSPFPRENLLVVQESINTRYAHRADTAELIATRIRQLVESHPGKYMVYFPSFAYLRQVDALLEDLPRQCQTSAMGQVERDAFLAPYLRGREPVLSLCVLGGIFAEGIDLPGTAPGWSDGGGRGPAPGETCSRKPSGRTTRKSWARALLMPTGFPGMQKVAQAVGRVIRTETDRGVALLMDDRYLQREYRQLCPEHWTLRRGNPQTLLKAFWREKIPAP